MNGRKEQLFLLCLSVACAVCLPTSAASETGKTEISAVKATAGVGEPPTDDAVGRYRPMDVYGKPAVLDTFSGTVAIINPDLSVVRVEAGEESGNLAGAESETVVNKPPRDNESPPPTLVTDDMRRAAMEVLARYGMKIGRTCITSLGRKGVVAAVELSNNSDVRIRAMELTFKGTAPGGHLEIQRIYVAEGKDEYGLLPQPGELRSAEVHLNRLTTSDVEMEMTYLQVAGNDSSRR